MIRPVMVAAGLILLLTACGTADPIDVPELPLMDDAILSEILTSGDPIVLNVWASWCIPCRSEAPLLAAAHAAFGDDVAFIGVDIEDTQDGARAFIAEYGLEFVSYFDRNGAVRAALGGDLQRRAG